MLKDIIFNTTTTIPINDANIQKGSDKRRVLLVDAEISTSGKVINGRIYPPAGHQSGIKSWYTPKGKAVIKYHDEVQDPIGRIVSAEWQNADHLALGYLRNNVSALADIKRAYSANNPKQIYKVMMDYNLTDAAWPGLGRVVGKLKITDQDAIEKFLDERFMHFSAGQATSAFWCMTCGSAWHKGEQCEHSFGSTDEDGKPIIYLCGEMKGRELSVVNNPANDTSFVLGMQLADNKQAEPIIVINDCINDNGHSVVDLILEKNMNLADLQTLDVKALIDLLTKEDKFVEFKDAISGDSHYEISWLVKIHDILHYTYDYSLKYDGETSTIPGGVFKLHGLLHDMSMMKDFRDSLVNGQLDNYSSEGRKSEEYIYKYADAVVPSPSLTLVEIQAIVDNAIVLATDKIIKEIKDGQKENERQEEVLIDEPVNDDSIDWAILDMALNSLLPEDAKLSSEKRESLPEKTFCGPDRSFPVPDCAHVSAARRLIGKAKLSEDQKDKVLACINRKAKNLSCDSSSNCNCNKPCTLCSEKDSKLSTLAEDYSNSLIRIEHLESILTDTVKAAITKLDSKIDFSDQSVDDLVEMFKQMTSNDKVEIKPLQPIDGASTALPKVTENAHTQEDSVERQRLSAFESMVVEKYKAVLLESGKDAANKYLHNQKTYLASDFNINNYIVEKE